MKSVIAVAFTSFFVVSTLGQGAFQNLDFESAQLIFIGETKSIETANALPGWTASSGANQLSEIPYNSPGLPNFVGLMGSNPSVISGSFTVILSGDGIISQIGLIPADARWLFFKGSWSSLSPLAVSLDGQELSYTALSSDPNHTLYGANISGFAGQTANLAFLATAGGGFWVDDIEFVVPEPSSLLLLSLGGLVFAAARTRVKAKN